MYEAREGGGKMKPIMFKDTKTLKNIVCQVDIKKNRIKIISAFHPWMNISYLLEGVGLSAELCIQEGKPKKEVYQGIQKYLMKVLASGYKLKPKNGEQKKN